jgi:hypothetical protein
MENPKARTITTTVIVTLLLASFIPGLNRLGPFVLHATATSLERTAHAVDSASGYHRHHDSEDN